MSAALGAGRTEQAHKLRLDLDDAARRWFRPRAMWVPDAVEAAVLLAEGDERAAEAAERARVRGEELGLATASLAAGAHLLVRHLLAGTMAQVAPLAAQASAHLTNTAAWTAAAALAEACAERHEAAAEHLAEYRRRADPDLWFKRAAAAVAAAAAFQLGDVEVAGGIHVALPADPDAVVLVGFGAAVVGPATLWTGLAAWTLGDCDTARRDLRSASVLAHAAGWPPWTEAADALVRALDDPTAPLPLGLVRPPT